MDLRKQSIINTIILFFLYVFAAALFLRGIGDESLGFPDADRILMDGVFLRDVLVDLPFSSPMDYAYNYFAQYPALSIGYRPPFFPGVEAIFNLTFGINMWSSRLALFLFAIAGITAWYKLVDRLYGSQAAVFSTLLWVSTPFVARWGWYTMGEIPVLSMVLVTAYFFYRFLETSAAKYLYLTAIFLGLSAWTKQTAVFAGVWFLLVLLVRGELLPVLRRRDTWLASILLAAIIAPLAALTLSFGDQNVYQSIGSMPTSGASRFSIENWLILIRNLFNYHLTLPFAVLALAGAAASVITKDRRAIFGVIGVLSVYLFFSLLVGKNARYAIFWIPLFALFAAAPLRYLSVHRLARTAFSALLAGVIVYQTVLVYQQTPAFAKGYKEAAAVALKNRKGPIVFIDAYNNGYLTYFFRQQDPNRSTYVLRGDKILTSASISAKHWLEVHASTYDDFRKILKQNAVSIIVVEDRDYTGLAPHKAFREFLKTDQFRLVDTIPITANRNISILPGSPPLNGRSLLIYENKAAADQPEGKLILKLPVVGRTIVIDWKKRKR